jgi:hypothetical protein
MAVTAVTSAVPRTAAAPAGTPAEAAAIASSWHDANQAYLIAAIARLRAALERHAARLRGQGATGEDAPPEPPPPVDSNELDALASAMPAPPALEQLRAVCGLSAFERDVVLLCAAVEFDATFAPLCAAIHGDTQRGYPTFSLALAALPEPHWSALVPNGPLRRWRLVEVGSGTALTQSPLRIDERVLHFLLGVQHTDERLQGLLQPAPVPDELVPSHEQVAARVAAAWARARGPHPPVLLLCGDDPSGKRAVAAAAGASLGLTLGVLAADALPTAPNDTDALARLWERESVLGARALLLDCDELDATDTAHGSALVRFVERTRGVLLVSSRERRRCGQRAVLAFDVGQPVSSEQRQVWHGALGDAAKRLNGHIDLLVSQFNLSAQSIRTAASEALEQAPGVPEADLGPALWDACRVHARPRLDDLAQRIEPAASWQDLILPEAQTQLLREVAVHVRQRAKVYEQWGFATKGSRGLGISALFAGASGTGKTMAAEVLANELRLDLYRIDLSATVSKYIGETEKNLRRVFDAAEEGGAILLFDEADALFGKRSEVKDSHDRYANIEVGYLLQRMEAYRGLAILTTNLKNSLDPAFLRRIRFVVQFPFPDAPQRAAIWRRIFPASTPVAGLDADALARLNVAGGNIRNIALNAAFLAADAGEAVTMAHILRAAQSEYAKLEKPLTEAEIGAWASA